MKIYQRNVNVQIVDTGGPQFKVRASLFDLVHCFDAEMLVDIESGRIEDVKMIMTRHPYLTACVRAVANVEKLKGEVIGRGITRRIKELIGGTQGCVHMVELLESAVRFTATNLIVHRSGLTHDSPMSEDEQRLKWLPILKNSCQVFRVASEEK